MRHTFLQWDIHYLVNDIHNPVNGIHGKQGIAIITQAISNKQQNKRRKRHDFMVCKIPIE